ncbi:MAG: DASS family sodium-coupled anion symporter [Bacteroidales bacterium]|nr:DASS family sodium-coupled anion symporter [Bacteroidales bacterium]
MQKGLLRKRIGFITGLLVFIFILTVRAGGSTDVNAKRAAACAALMAVWWITEAIPIPATALLPAVLYPLLKIMSAKEALLSYADRNIFLFMGGFFIAMAMQRHNLHKRIALHIIWLIGTSSRRLVLGFMIATAFLSMWISNTATTMMMLPIGMAVISHVQSRAEEENPDIVSGRHHFRFATVLMLAIAYSASIGGIGTLVGTPPNIIFAGMIRNTLPGYPEIDFITWMKIGLPIVIIFLPLAWIYLVFIGPPQKMNRIPGGSILIKNEIRALGKMNKGEAITLIVFCLTALGWIFRTNISIGRFTITGWTNMLGIEEYVHDSTVALTGAMLLFIIPTSLKKYEFVLNWEWAKRIPWGILILFGGGFALASSFQSTGLDKWIGTMFAGINGASVLILIISVCLLLTFLTEITSNTATITMMLPVLAAMALSMKIHPFILMIPATISTSCAFMLPVATPPNAIVFGSEYIEMHQMARIGFFMNLMGVVIITSLMYLVIFPMLTIRMGL